VAANLGGDERRLVEPRIVSAWLIFVFGGKWNNALTSESSETAEASLSIAPACNDFIVFYLVCPALSVLNKFL
jgi:hypothetical protein